jgi:O-antigen/teichoic acid export membrane protein
MINKIRQFKETELFNVFFFTALSTLVKIITAFVLSKVIAVILGPVGLGLMGQLSNFIAIVLVIAGGAINNGLVKYTAEYSKYEPQNIKYLLSTGFKIIVVSCVIVGGATMSFSCFLSEQILFDSKYFYIFLVFGLFLFLSTFNVLLLSVLNGLKDYRKYNYLNIVGSLCNLFFSCILIYFFEIAGALISLVLNQSIICLLSIYQLRKEVWFTKSNFLGKTDKNILKLLYKFITLAIFSSLLGPIAQFIIRNFIIEKLSLKSAGLWESLNRISAMYLMFFSLTITTYYLPRFSEIIYKKELIIELKKIYFILIPVLVIVALSIYLFRENIIEILFSNSFSGASDLFLYQLIGDVVKICSWIIGFQLLAKAMIRVSIYTELGYNIVFVVLGLFFIDNFGLIGITYAYVISYIIYLCIMIVIFKFYMLRRIYK